MADNFDDLVRDVLAAPLGEVIASVGRGVAEAQAALDAGSIAQTLEIYREGGEAELQVMREIGYRPTFYALPETTGEVRVSLNLGNAAQSPAAPVVSGSASRRLSALTASRVKSVRPYITPVNAGYANRYSYSAEAAARITFRIVPTPAPEGADEIREIPALVGRNLAEALGVLEGLGLEASLIDASGAPVAVPEGPATVAAQTPAAEAIGRLGDSVELTVKTG